jgi:CheY-like chemotaxis protein
MRVRRGVETQIPVRNQVRLAGLHILVVDDSEINREVAQRIFASEGAQVSLATNGKEALDWLQTSGNKTDIVLMDVQMPVLSGHEATRQIRRLKEFSDLPIVALTAGAFTGQQELASESGMTGFLSKPFDVEAAIALIIKLTGHRSPHPEELEPVPPSQPLSPIENMPGISMSKGLAIWRNVSIFKKYLRMFEQTYANIALEVRRLNGTEAQALLHKFKGASGNLALDEVAASADAVERALRLGDSPDEALDRLRTAMDVVLESIQKFAPQEFDSGLNSLHPSDAPHLAELLKKLLLAWSSSRSKEIRQALTDVAKLVPSDQLEPLQAALDAYDFHTGATLTRALMGVTQSKMEDA